MKKVYAVLIITLLSIMGFSILPEYISIEMGEEAPTRGSEYWKMDMDMSFASFASFIGEEQSDESGVSVSGAGDVNGDGYDDILIGAWRNDDGGTGAGKAYLILGDASSLTMDTDLSKADASFIGEVNTDQAGYSVSGAGDVNGDGYDDILIGAYHNDEGGYNAGQTYLILGKSTGWRMNIDLSNADASFIGEYDEDNSGDSVSSAGDVNRDGYDDILIGAYLNNDGGSASGQTYMILGKSSGWAMDTDLSNANASFIGEDGGDHSGRPVSGAGDVNGDGYDDILIGAHYDEEGGQDAGQTYLVLGMASGWEMDTDLSKADASFIGEDAGDDSGRSVSGAGDVNGDGYDDILIGAYRDDDGDSTAGQTYLILGKSSGWAMDTDLSEANASFIGEDRGDRSGWSASGAGDVNGDGYDDIIIGAWRNGDGGAEAGQSYLILGKSSNWTMDTDLSKATASFIGENGADYSGYAVSGAGDVNGDGFDDMLIGADGNDDGSTNAGKSYLIRGMANMIFKTDNTPRKATTGEKFTFSINIHEKLSIPTIFVEYWYSGSYHSNVSMINVYDNTWNLTISIASDANDDINYYFCTQYITSIWTNTSIKNVTIFDNDNPEFGMDFTDKSAYTGDPYTFSIEVMDNINVEIVNIEYWFGNNNHLILNAEKEWVNRWGNTIAIPLNSLDVLHYKFIAHDYSDNRNHTQIKDISIFDNDQPEFVIRNTPTTATTRIHFTFSINVIDNIEVSSVFVEYWYGSEPITNSSLEKGVENEWHLGIDILDTLETLQYVFHATDTANNWNETMKRNVPIIDNILPEFGEDRSETSATTGDDFTFGIEINDNIDLLTIYVEYWCNEGEHLKSTLYGEGSFTSTVSIPMNWTKFHYSFHAVDTAENRNETEPKEIDVLDNDPPSITDDSTPNTCNTGEDFDFSVNATDNIGLSSLNIEYWYGEKNPEVLFLENIKDHYMGSIPIPENSLESLNYKIKVFDTSDNWYETNPIEVSITDSISPTLKAIPDVTIYQGDEINITLEAMDNIGIVTYSWYGSPIDNVNDNQLYGILNEVDSYVINIIVIDEQGNSNSTIFSINVLSVDHDEDQDGIPDLIEILYGLDPNVDTDAAGDLDNDNLTNKEEFDLGTYLNKSDTDGDGLSDGYEVKNGYDPLDPLSAGKITDSEDGSSSAWIWIMIILIVIIICIVIGSVIFLIMRKVKTSEEGSIQEPISKEVSNVSQIPTKPSLTPSSLPNKPQLPISTSPPLARQQSLSVAPLPVSALQMPQAQKPVQGHPQTPNQQPTTTTPAREPSPPSTI